MRDCSGGKVALDKLLGHGNWEKHFWVENGLIHLEQQGMSGELFNGIDDKFYIFYFGQQGLWAQGFGKMEPKWQFMSKKWDDSFCTICGWCASMRIVAHLMSIAIYIRMANPSGGGVSKPKVRIVWIITLSCQDKDKDMEVMGGVWWLSAHINYPSVPFLK